MKRILAILCVIACLCGLCVPAMAAAVDLGGLKSLALVGIGVPGAADWTPGDAAGDFTKASEGVYVKVIAVSAGHAMSFKIAGNDAWDDAYNFGGMEDGVVVALGTKIELANGGGSKDISLTATKDGNLKFTVDLNGDVPTLVVEETTDAVTGPGTPSTPSTPSAPAKPNSLALAGTGIPGVAEWNPGDPAGDFTEVSSGVYVKIVGCPAGTAMSFKIAGNDAWDDNFNYGGAADGVTVALGVKIDLTNGSGSKDLSLTVDEHTNLKFTVDLTGATPTLLVEKTDEEPGDIPSNPGTPSTPTVPDGEGITVYAQVPDDWATVLLWAWDDNDNNAVPGASWPGTLFMTKGADGWYSVRIPLGFTNMLVTNGNGAQCPDMKGLEAGKDIYINAKTDVNNPTVTYEKVDIAPPAETEPPSVATKPLVAPEASDSNNKPAGTDNTVLFCIIGSVVVIAIAAVVFFILKGKKKA